MAFIPVPGTWEIAVKQIFGNAVFPVNTYYVKPNAPTTLDQSHADFVAELIENAYESSGLQARMATTWALDEIVVTDLTSTTAPSILGSFDALAGTDATETLAPQTAGMIEWGTSLRGRSFRGRTFLTGFCEDSNIGTPTAAAQVAMQDFAGTLVTGLGTGGYPMQVVSRFSGTHLQGPDLRGRIRLVPTPRVTGLATPITTAVAETVWKTQRRRTLPG
jgi:hypothetical protein